jgi:hypothetical protein
VPENVTFHPLFFASCAISHFPFFTDNNRIIPFRNSRFTT